MPYNEARKRATAKYKAKAMKRIPLDVQLAEYEAIKNAADSSGESVNGYIRKAVKTRIENEAKERED